MISTWRHLLIIQPLVGIGDMIWHKPWIDHLSHTHKITLASKPSVRAEILFHDAPNGFAVLPIHRSSRGIKGQHDGIFGFLRLIKDFRQTGADAAIILHQSPRYALAARLAGIKARFGYGMNRQRRHLNYGQFLDQTCQSWHAIDRIAHFAQMNDFGLAQPNWSLTVSNRAADKAAQFLSQHHLLDNNRKAKDFLIIGVGAMNPERQWGAKNYTQLIIKLKAERANLALVILAGPAEKALCDEIVARLVAESIEVPVNIDKLDIAIAVMAESLGYIGNDTGHLNIMACLSRPALGLYSHSKPLTYSPFLKKLNLFEDDDYGKIGLIQRITPKDVMTGITSIWPAK